MSAKNIKSPGPKKPASAATNLIGTHGLTLLPEATLTIMRSWRRCGHDGGSGLSSIGLVEGRTLKAALLTIFKTQSKSGCSCHGAPEHQEFEPLSHAHKRQISDRINSGEATRLLGNRKGDCEARNTPGSLQGLGRRPDWHHTKNGYTVHILRHLQTGIGK